MKQIFVVFAVVVSLVSFARPALASTSTLESFLTSLDGEWTGQGDRKASPDVLGEIISGPVENARLLGQSKVLDRLPALSFRLVRFVKSEQTPGHTDRLFTGLNLKAFGETLLVENFDESRPNIQATVTDSTDHSLGFAYDDIRCRHDDARNCTLFETRIQLVLSGAKTLSISLQKLQQTPLNHWSVVADETLTLSK